MITESAHAAVLVGANHHFTRRNQSCIQGEERMLRLCVEVLFGGKTKIYLRNVLDLSEPPGGLATNIR